MHSFTQITSRIELRGIIPSNQIKVTFIIILFYPSAWYVFDFLNVGGLLGGGGGGVGGGGEGGKGYVGPPLKLLGGGAFPPPPPPPPPHLSST